MTGHARVFNTHGARPWESITFNIILWVDHCISEMVVCDLAMQCMMFRSAIIVGVKQESICTE